jgi:HK97 family phage portal protein
MKIWQSVRQLFASQPDPGDDFWYKSVPMPAWAQAALEPEKIKCSAAMACIRVIADTIAALPLSLYERLDRGKKLAINHPLFQLLHTSPNGQITSFEWRSLMMHHLLTVGNHYSRYHSDRAGRVYNITPIVPTDVTRVYTDPETDVKLFEVSGKSGRQTLTENEILHIPGFSWDGFKGLSPIELNEDLLRHAIGAEKFGMSFFANDAAPSVYVSFPAGSNLSAQSRTELKEWLRKNHNGPSGWNTPGVFEGGGEIKAVERNLSNLQFLELRKFLVEEVARVYRVPLHLIQSLDRATNNNIEHQAIDFVQYTLLPYLKLIEARLNLILLGPIESGRYFAEFNVDGLLRGDSAARATFYAQGIASAYLMPNEVREKENLLPVEGGDRLYIQGAMVPLEMAGEAIKQAAEAADKTEEPAAKTEEKQAVTK